MVRYIFKRKKILGRCTVIFQKIVLTHLNMLHTFKVPIHSLCIWKAIDEL